MIQLKNLFKSHNIDQQELSVLKNINLHIHKGEFVAIMGPSGSGKSTLLHLLAGLDVPTRGDVEIDGINISLLTETERTILRRRKMGFIFQDYQLLSSMTVEENISFPLWADRASKIEVKTKVNRLLESVGLSDKLNVLPSKLSGGQKQRVAIARALAMGPRLVLADEPTGNLDRKKGNEILQLLSKLHKEDHLTIVMVTHDYYAAGFADRIITVQDGQIIEEFNERGDKHEIILHELAELNS